MNSETDRFGTISQRVKPKKCTVTICAKTYIPHYWGSLAAAREGWFLQRNGAAWCPEHLPAWVDAWRKNK